MYVCCVHGNYGEEEMKKRRPRCGPRYCMQERFTNVTFDDNNESSLGKQTVMYMRQSMEIIHGYTVSLSYIHMFSISRHKDTPANNEYGVWNRQLSESPSWPL